MYFAKYVRVMSVDKEKTKNVLVVGVVRSVINLHPGPGSMNFTGKPYLPVIFGPTK